ncbi:uroporphyrinogen-III C-methyltransferase [Vibrio coralliilyticus]|uniref:uroporphyrinogen-III C-methyltransferase n=1 Tax=Vibrio coralliilyticus TaxID=190893 RepID=UPI00155FCE13|nr:uroporphyrinogen-III C-methyltransferase [Vibrio coralliilyticus]NRF14741.1 uroporphyrinogen-III C-methyltransferase [Vibrio coralliilyticus]NRF30736.1 uroporphyrinogen-III C-methyltransferase [Vibrio coralliilyticus]NRF55543.1 uroporphyrinogen-III C-methyltransferase [Vibrio coralliilyticus]NRG04615.1 uroporphyrinogen-III C-methyltransferase [Vibrio coralliilyticus]
MKYDINLREGSYSDLKGASFSEHRRLYNDSCKLHKLDRYRTKGKVYLVGAGPNDPDLLTVKALKLIKQADVVVYDRLVNREILELAEKAEKRVYVGKRCGQPSLKQEEISQILVDLAESGYMVVRLKGGDPFIFGRGGEEGLLLAQNNIDYEVVPGITAAIGCAAASYIPLTHRALARSVTFVTGQVVSGALPAWAQLVSSGQTLVFYMGLEKASEIQEGLLRHGMRDDFPLAVVTHGCSSQQKVHVSSLSRLTSLSEALKGVSPALIILGEVVTLREQLNATVESVISQEVT